MELHSLLSVQDAVRTVIEINLMHPPSVWTWSQSLSKRITWNSCFFVFLNAAGRINALLTNLSPWITSPETIEWTSQIRRKFMSERFWFGGAIIEWTSQVRAGRCFLVGGHVLACLANCMFNFPRYLKKTLWEQDCFPVFAILRFRKMIFPQNDSACLLT